MRTIEIPGGTAQIREKADMRMRQKQLVEAASMAAANAIRKLPDDPNLPALMEAALNDDKDALKRLDQLTEKTDLSLKELMALVDLQNAVIVSYVASWTRPEPIPTMDTVGDMEPEVYEAIAEETKTEAARLATGQMGVNFDPTPDQSRPTGPSSASDGLLREGQTLPSIETLSPAGESIDTAPATTV